jgi:hypothetical protein
MKVEIDAREVRGVWRSGSSSCVMVTLEMDGRQCKDAIIDLMSHDGEQAVFEWLKSVYPEWFEVAK